MVRPDDSGSSGPSALDQLTTSLVSGAPAKKAAPAKKKAPAKKASRSRPAATAGMTGLESAFGSALARMIAAAPGAITITSGRRTRAQQQKHYNDYLAGKGPLAAKPGTSKHESGFAADLHFASPAVEKWAHDNAARFGLAFPVSGESWHVELAGAPDAAGGAAASQTTTAAADATAGGPLPANATPQQIKDEVARSYGYLAAFLNDPEIGPILSKAAIEDWDEARLTGALTATKWWKTHSDVTRQWDALNKLDPAKAKAQLNAQMASIRDLAQQRGIILPGNLLHDMSVNALRFGWNTAQVNDALEQQGKLDPKVKATNVQKLRELANEWMVPMSDSALDKWSKDITFGRMTDDDYAQYLKDQAKSLFPNLASAIDRGVSVRQYTDPYRQYAAQILEISPDSIDFMHDPKFSKALFNTNPKTGEREQMSLSDWQRYLRSTPDYAKTAGAVDGAAQFADMLTREFGKVA